jgi:hypothetical protein
MKATGISINKHIYSILSQNSDLKKIVNKKIYPLIAEESTTFPFIVFKKNTITTEYCKDGSTLDRVNFSIVSVARDYTTTVTISEIVRNSIEMLKDEYFKLVHLSQVTEDYIDDVYTQELSFDAII